MLNSSPTAMAPVKVNLSAATTTALPLLYRDAKLPQASPI
jgi:hypothetical protein